MIWGYPYFRKPPYLQGCRQSHTQHGDSDVFLRTFLVTKIGNEHVDFSRHEHDPETPNGPVFFCGATAEHDKLMSLGLIIIDIDRWPLCLRVHLQTCGCSLTGARSSRWVWQGGVSVVGAPLMAPVLLHLSYCFSINQETRNFSSNCWSPKHIRWFQILHMTSIAHENCRVPDLKHGSE